MARRKKNPLSTAAKLGLAALGTAAVVGGTVAYQRSQDEKAKKKKSETTKKSPLSGTYAPGATIAASGTIMKEAALPVVLNKENTARLQLRTTDGDIVDVWQTADEVSVATTDELGQLVTDLTADMGSERGAATKAWNMMNHLVANKGYDLENPQMRDQAVQETLAVVAPNMDWSKGLQPYTVDSPPYQVWTGVELLGTIAYQSYWNKKVLEVGDVASSGTSVGGVKWQVVYTGNNQLNMPQYMAQVFEPEGEPIPGFGQPGNWIDIDVYVKLEDAVGAAKGAASGGMLDAKVGDAVAQGTEGPVQWRTVFAYEPGNPNSPRPGYGPGEKRNVYDGEFLDPSGGFDQWSSFGSGYFDSAKAIQETKALAKQRPWA